MGLVSSWSYPLLLFSLALHSLGCTFPLLLLPPSISSSVGLCVCSLSSFTDNHVVMTHYSFTSLAFPISYRFYGVLPINLSENPLFLLFIFLCFIILVITNTVKMRSPYSTQAPEQKQSSYLRLPNSQERFIWCIAASLLLQHLLDPKYYTI